MRSNLLMNCLWYEDISPEELANILEITPERVIDFSGNYEEFTLGEIQRIVGLLGLTEAETETIFFE